MILISACLCGVACRYNGKDAANPEALFLVQTGKCILVCPEQLGGLSTPRQPAEICGGDGRDVLLGRAQVRDCAGVDVTAAFVQGAQQALSIARLSGADQAILKQGSPSCGCGCIHDGSFAGKLRNGDGVCATILKRHGIHVRPL